MVESKYISTEFWRKAAVDFEFDRYEYASEVYDRASDESRIRNGWECIAHKIGIGCEWHQLYRRPLVSCRAPDQAAAGPLTGSDQKISAPADQVVYDHQTYDYCWVNYDPNSDEDLRQLGWESLSNDIDENRRLYRRLISQRAFNKSKPTAAVKPALTLDDYALALHAVDCFDSDEERKRDGLPMVEKWANPWHPAGARQLKKLRKRAEVFYTALVERQEQDKYDF